MGMMSTLGDLGITLMETHIRQHLMILSEFQIVMQLSFQLKILGEFSSFSPRDAQSLNILELSPVNIF
ncbi:hypothetical protein B1772_03455 [Dehalococcoides mccartyi]|jgi:hypothetical protein|nr:hypothetical protein B1776_03145 [Dehalococcoides mccartyi]AQY73139.1 hypothetical protein B1772_03455 [Dehalococcoides mccartyi]